MAGTIFKIMGANKYWLRIIFLVLAAFTTSGLYAQGMYTTKWFKYTNEAEHYSANFPMRPFSKIDSVPKYMWLRRTDAVADMSKMMAFPKSFIITTFDYADTVMNNVKMAHLQDAYADSLVIHACAGKDPEIVKWSAVKKDGVLGKAYELNLKKTMFIGKAY